MKTVTLLLFTALAAFGNAQQLQNPGFEEWSVTGTTFDNQPVYSPTHWQGGSQTTDSYTGAYAASVPPIPSCGISYGWMVYGATDPNHFNIWQPEPDFTGSGSPVNFKPTVISGRFKFLSPDSTDQAYGIVILKKQAQEIGRGEITFTPTETYTYFSITISDLQPGVNPDSLVVAFSSGTGYDWDWQTDVVSMGTLYLDQVGMAGSPLAGLTDQSQLECRFFPNPATGMLHYSFNATANDQFFLELTDASGKQVFLQKTEPGIEHTIDLGGLAAGSYHAVIKGAVGVYTERLIVKE